MAQTEDVGYPLPFLAKEQGCPIAAALIDRFCRDLAIGIDSLVHVLDPRHVVLAGAITSQGDRLLTPLLQHLHTDIPVTLAAHYEHAGVIGAARLFKGKDI
jgi:predicted NBD/HSP70 family sugar kinase